MQINKLAAACAVVLAGVSAPALALTAFETPDLKIFLSGASAPDNFLESIATGMFVGTKGTDWFKYTDSAAQQRAFFGVMKGVADGVPATLAGKKVLFIKRSTGGSVFGVNPVARAEALAVLKIASGVGGCTPSGVDYTCPVVGVDPGVGTPTGDELVADFGVSDVGPALFKEPYNVEFGKTQLSSAEVAGMTVTQVNTLAMGLAVTNAVPDTTYFSKAIYGALLSGNLSDWTQVDAALAPAAGPQVVVCRRVPGSGTQTSYNWFFNNFPCATNSIAGSGNTQPTRMSDSASGIVSGTGTVADPFIIDPNAGYTVIENSTSGDVRNCLTKAAAGGVHTFKDEEGKSYSVTFDSDAGTAGNQGGYGAVGVLSVDSLNSTGNAANKWSFRAIDGAGMYYDSDSTATIVPTSTGNGVHPSKSNIIEGKYEFASELTMQYRNDLAGLKKTFADFFIARAGDPAFNSSAWVAALPPTYDPTTTANVAKGTRFGNMCAPLQRLF
ncbi:MAG: hypothetical protein FD157_3894 [Rhodocyclaceae bacterium]|nr:MAG: hypothetical protein FD157_3894 [Rhodocyclaceae bacterium]TNC99467.1 MAG: hypothetical protein FD118_3695 [Rhodocyclaceae bacterium]